MALPLAEAFTARSLGVMWNNYEKTLGSAPYLGRQKFGTRKQDSLELRFIKGKNGLPLSLKASNFDAQAELRDVGGFSDIQNEMPFYRESYMVTEREEQKYANYQSAENSNMANQVLREISKKPMMLIEGARVVPERQIWQLLAPSDGIPRVQVTIGGKSYYVDYTSDNGVSHKRDHYKDISGSDTDKWSASETATPLDDLIEIKREFAKKTGYSLARFSMNTETWEMVLRQKTQRNRCLELLLTMEVFVYSRGRLQSILEDTASRLKFTTNFTSTRQTVPPNILFLQELFQRRHPACTLEIMSLERHRKREAEV